MKIKKKKYKKKKSIWKNKIFLISVPSFLFIIGILYLLFFSPVFAVKHIENNNAEIREIAERFIERKILFLKTKSILVYPKDSLKQKILSEFITLEDTFVKKRLFSKILIETKQRQPRAVVFNEKYFAIDQNGLIFKEIQEIPELPLIYFNRELRIGDHVLDKNVLKTILVIDKELKNKTDLLVDQYTILQDRIETKTQEISLFFDKDKDITLQVADLTLVLIEVSLEDLEYIDLRFDKVFYK